MMSNGRARVTPKIDERSASPASSHRVSRSPGCSGTVTQNASRVEAMRCSIHLCTLAAHPLSLAQPRPPAGRTIRPCAASPAMGRDNAGFKSHSPGCRDHLPRPWARRPLRRGTSARGLPDLLPGEHPARGRGRPMRLVRLRPLPRRRGACAREGSVSRRRLGPGARRIRPPRPGADRPPRPASSISAERPASPPGSRGFGGGRRLRRGRDTWEVSGRAPGHPNDPADPVGLSNVHVGRALQELGCRGVIEHKGGTRKLRNRQQLKSMAESNPKSLYLGTLATA